MRKIFQLFLLSFSATLLLAQQGNYADSVLDQLKLIKRADGKDSIYIRKAERLMYRNKNEMLLTNKSIIQELDRLRNVLDEKKYNDFFVNFYEGQIANDSIPKETEIIFGRNFIEKNKNNRSGYGDTAFYWILRDLRLPYRNSSHIYEGIEYFSNLSNYFTEKGDSSAATIVFDVLAGFYYRLGLIDKSEYYLLKSIDYLNDNCFNTYNSIFFGTSGKVHRFMLLGASMLDNDKPELAEKYLTIAINYFSELHSPLLFADPPYLFLEMARCKTLLKNDSSSYYFNKAFDFLKLYNLSDSLMEYAWCYMEKAKYHLSKNQNDSAAFYIKKVKFLKSSQQMGITSPFGELIPDYYAATLSLLRNKPREAIELLLPEIQQLKAINANTSIIMELKLLAKAYATAGKYQEAFKTEEDLLQVNEELKKKSDKAKTISYEIEKRIQDNENNILRLKAQDENNRKTKYYLYGIAALLALFVITLGIAIMNKQKSNARLNTKNAEVSSALEHLKQTQSQLIQSEKMASLGELTAGIAHEIQNPLNFVNNFSEVNSELAEELKSELAVGNSQLAIGIANDIKENSEKINHHGKRADAIVKGMLQHSRSSTSVKEMTNINALADEYLRLAYHGLRAKDNSFNATIKTDFDQSIGNINIIPQDIGRVLLNLYNNAFYAVSEKKKSNVEGYEPTVSVSTKKSDNKITITASDNGDGIPQKVVDKIFQPFFTTKPTGQGTGLGLSLSYDIIKAHGGEIKVDTKEGEGSEFLIWLPIV